MFLLAVAAAASAVTISPQLEAKGQFAFTYGACRVYSTANQRAEMESNIKAIPNQFERGYIQALYEGGVKYGRQRHIAFPICQALVNDSLANIAK